VDHLLLHCDCICILELVFFVFGFRQFSVYCRRALLVFYLVGQILFLCLESRLFMVVVDTVEREESSYI
jgi:hypothetical protein